MLFKCTVVILSLYTDVEACHFTCHDWQSQYLCEEAGCYYLVQYMVGTTELS